MPDMPLRFDKIIAILAILPGRMERIFACVIMTCNPSSLQTPTKRVFGVQALALFDAPFMNSSISSSMYSLPCECSGS